jgi:hypothetical protein
MPDRAVNSRPLLTLKSFKAKEIEMELRNVHGDEALQIFAVKKQRTRFLQGRTELGDNPRRGRPDNSDLTRVIAELILESLFLSCKILYRYLRLSKERCLRILQEKYGPKKFRLRWVSHQHISKMKIARVAMPHQFLEILQHCQATNFMNF